MAAAQPAAATASATASSSASSAASQPTAVHTCSLAFDIVVLLNDAHATAPSVAASSHSRTHIPHFRYTDVAGEYVTTEPVGGPGWEPVVYPSAPDAADTAAVRGKSAPKSAHAGAQPASAMSTSAGGKLGGAVSDSALGGSAGGAAPRLVRHTHTVTGVTIDAAWVHAFHANPMMHVIMGLSPDPAFTPTGATPIPDSAAASKAAAPSGKSTKTSGADKGKDAAPTAPVAATAPAVVTRAHPFCAWIPLDMSPLLANDTSVSHVFGSVNAAVTALGATRAPPSPRAADGPAPTHASSSPRSSAKASTSAGAAPSRGAPAAAPSAAASEAPATDAHPATLPPLTVTDLASTLGIQLPGDDVTSLPPPNSIKFLAVAVRVTQASRTDFAAPTLAETAAAPAGSRTSVKVKPAVAPAAKAAAPASEPAVSSVVLPPRLLSNELLDFVNPMRIRLERADNLPGIVLPAGSDSSLRKFTEPTPFALLAANCRPVYAVLRWFTLRQRPAPPPVATLRASEPVPAAATSGKIGTAASRSAATSASSKPASAAAATATATVPAAAASSASTAPFPADASESVQNVFDLGLDGQLRVRPAVLFQKPLRRGMVTPAVAPSARCAWNSNFVVCLGLYDRTALREALQTQPLCVEVHDRDVLMWERLQEQGERASQPATAPATKAAAPTTTLTVHMMTPPAPAPSSGPSSARPSSPGGPRSDATAAAAKASAKAPGASSTPAAKSTSSGKPASPGSSADAAASGAAAMPVPEPIMIDAAAQELPSFWPFLSLPAERRELYEGLAAGTMPCPFERYHKHPEIAGDGKASSTSGSTAAASTGTARKSGQPTDSRATSASTAKTPGTSGTAQPPSPGSHAKHPTQQLDGMLVAELSARVLAAHERHAHASADVRLSHLLDRHEERLRIIADRFASGSAGSSRPRSSAPASAAAASLSVTSYAKPELQQSNNVSQLCDRFPLQPRKRTVVPLVPEPLHALSREQTLCALPASYRETDAFLKLAAHVHRPESLHSVPAFVAEPPPPFERVVVSFRYDNDDLLHSIMHCIEEVNAAALPHASSFRSHVLTSDEMKRANDGALDIITGLHMVSGALRIFVLEGLGTPQGRGIAALSGVLQHDRPNSRDYKLLANPEVRYNVRLYTAFNTAPKNIRLRAPISKLLQQSAAPELTAPWRRAVEAVHVMLQSDTAALLKQLDTFPAVPDLLELENKFGDTVSLQDVFGMNYPAARAVKESKGALEVAEQKAMAHVPAAVDASKLLSTLQLEQERRHLEDATAQKAAESKAATTSTRVGVTALMANDAWLLQREERATTRKERDVVEEHAADIARMSAAVRQQRAAELEAKYGREEAERVLHWRELSATALPTSSLPGGQVFMYSGQKLNTTEWQRRVLRERLAKDRRATYSYSAGFNSATVTVVDDTELAKLEAAAERAKWKTQRGFVYPAPRDPSTYYEHPGKPTPARIDELREPWEDAYSRAAVAESRGPPASGEDVARFLNMPDPHPTEHGVFGYVDASGVKVPDHEFYKSVHLSSAGMDAERRAAKERVQREWTDKLVVDSPVFRRHHSADASKSGRMHGLLASAPVKAGLVAIRTATLPSGKSVPLEEPPVSMFLGDPIATRPLSPLRLRSDSRKPLPPGSVSFKVSSSTAVAGVLHRPTTSESLRPDSAVGRSNVPRTHVAGINTDTR